MTSWKRDQEYFLEMRKPTQVTRKARLQILRVVTMERKKNTDAVDLVLHIDVIALRKQEQQRTMTLVPQRAGQGQDQTQDKKNRMTNRYVMLWETA